ncbi:hypothetical protein ACHAPX_008847 [Trichoderma viride]
MAEYVRKLRLRARRSTISSAIKAEEEVARRGDGEARVFEEQLRIVEAQLRNAQELKQELEAAHLSPGSVRPPTPPATPPENEQKEIALPEEPDTAQARPTCRSVTVSWPKPGKVAVLGYGNLEMAKDECAKFNGASFPRGQSKLVGGHKVTATLSPEAGPDEAPRASRVSSQVTVLFEPSVKTADESLRRSIRKTLIPSPRQVTMGGYTAPIAEMKDAVRELLEAHAPLEWFELFDDSTGARLEAIAWFPDPAGALGACRELDKTPLPFYPEGQLSVRLHERTEACDIRCHK